MGFFPSPVYLVFVPVLISGVVSAGFNIASNDFIYDNVRAEKRGLAVSYFNMLNGIRNIHRCRYWSIFNSIFEYTVSKANICNILGEWYYWNNLCVAVPA